MDQNESTQLGHIAGTLEGLVNTVEAMHKSVTVKLGDHEVRIRSSEKWRNRFNGAAAFVVFIIGAITAIGAVLKWA